MVGLAALRKCLPASRHEQAYALITTVDSLGTGCFLTVSVVLFVRLIGVSPTQIGAALGVGGVLSLFARVPLGRLSDRIGHRRTLIWVHLIRGLAFPGYLLVHGFAGFAVLSVFLLIIDGWESPVRKVVLYAFAPLQDRVRIAAYNRSVYNLAFSIGSLLAALALAAQDSRLGLYLVIIGNSASFLVAAALAARLPADPERGPLGSGVTVRPGRYAVVGLLCGSLFLCTSILTIGIPLLILQNFRSHQWLIGLAMALNTIVAVALQVRISRGSTDIVGAARAGLLGGLSLAVACLLFFASVRAPTAAGVLVLLVAVVALSIGELYASAATWGLSVSLRRHDLTAHNQSIWSMYNSLPQLLGPFIVAWLLNGLGDYAWPVLGALLAAAAVALRPVSLSVHRRIELSAGETSRSIPPAPPPANDNQLRPQFEGEPSAR